MSSKFMMHVKEDSSLTTFEFLDEGEWFALERLIGGNDGSVQLYMKVSGPYVDSVDLSSGKTTSLGDDKEVYRVSSETKWKYL